MLLCTFLPLFCSQSIATAQTPAQYRLLDSFLVVNSKHLAQDSVKMTIYREVARAYSRVKNVEKLEEFTQKAVELSIRLNIRIFAGHSYNRLALFYHGRAEKDKALENYQKAIEQYRMIHDLDNEAGIYLNLGALYLDIPDYNKALSMNEKAIAIYLKNGNEGDLASCYANISTIYRILDQHSRTVEYSQKALQVFKKEGPNVRGVAITSHIIGRTYLMAPERELIKMGIHSKEEKIEQAFKYLSEGLRIGTLLRDFSVCSNVSMDIGSLYSENNQPELALSTYLKAVEFSDLSDAPEDDVLSRIALAKFYISTKNYNKAIPLLEEALVHAKKDKLFIAQNEANEALSMAYEGLGKYQSSLEFYKKYITGKNELFDAEKEQEMTRKMMQIDFNVKENEYRLQQKITDGELKQQVLLAQQRQQQLKLSDTEKKLQRLEFLKKQADLENEQKLQSSNFQRIQLQSENATLARDKQISQQDQQIKFDGKIKITLSIVLLLVLLTAALVYVNQRKTRKLNQIISRQKLEVEQLNKVKDKMFSVVSHDMRTPVNSLISFMQLLEEGDIGRDKLNRYAASLKSNLIYTSSMMENLLSWAASQMQGFQSYMEILKVQYLVGNVMQALETEAAQKKLTIQNLIPEDAVCMADTNMLALVLRNLISNAIKFTPQNGIISVTAMDQKDTLQIMVADTGVGMTPEQIRHFNKLENHLEAGTSTLGTNKEKGTGLGLFLCRTFLPLMGGHIKAGAGENGGTTFTLILKKG